jgi:hypothetical protein
MPITKHEFAVALTREKTLLDQVLTGACLGYLSIESEMPRNDEQGFPSSDYLKSYENRILGVVRYSNLRALVDNLSPEDPETAWVGVAKGRIKQIGQQIVRFRGIENSRLFSEDAVDEQRELYREMREVMPDDNPEEWNGRPSIRPTGGPVI